VIDRQLLARVMGACLALVLGGGALAVDTSWIYDGNGNWTEAAKWSNGEPDAAAFNAFISNLGNGVAIDLNESRTIGRLAIASGGLTIQSLTATPITLSVANGITNDGAIYLQGTTAGSTLVADGAGLDNSGFVMLQSVAATFQGNLTNSDTFWVWGTATFDKPGAVYTNTGFFDIVTGSLTISGGTFNQNSTQPNYFRNGATLNLTNGSTLNINSAKLDNYGLVTLSSDSQINLHTGATLFMWGDITGSGTITQDGGAVDYVDGSIGGNYHYVSGTVDTGTKLTGATLYLDSANPVAFKLDGDNALATDTFQGQVLTVSSTGNSFKGLTSATGFTNNGTIEVQNSLTQLVVTTGALTNGPTGLLNFSGGLRFTGDLVNNGSVLVDSNIGFNKPGGSYINNADFTVKSGNSSTVKDGSVFQQNAGTFEVDGILRFFKDGVVNLNGGVTNVKSWLATDAGATINLPTGGTLNVMGSVGGSGVFNQSGGTLNYTSGSISGNFNYFGGTITGVPVLSNSTLTVADGITGPIAFILTGDSKVVLPNNTLLAGQSLTARRGSETNQLLTLADDFINSGSLYVHGTSSGATKLTLAHVTRLYNISTGLLQFQAGGTGTRTFTGDLTNDGTVQVLAPTTFDKSSGLFTNNGQFTVGSGQSLSISNSSSGTTFDQAAGNLDVQGTMTLTSSTFRYLGGAISGAVTINNGSLVIGSGVTGPGSFIFDGNSTATLTDNALLAGQSLTARRTSSSGTQGLTVANGFTNNGSIYLAGTISTTTMTVTNGTLVNNAGGLVQFQAGGGVRTIVGNLTNNGSVQVNQATTLSGGKTFEQAAGGTLDVNSALTVSSSTFKYSGGTINGVPLLSSSTLVVTAGATNPASFILEGPSTLSLPDNILPAGQLTVRNTTTGTQGLTSANGFTNNASILLTGTTFGTTTLAVTNGTLVNDSTGSLQFLSTATGNRIMSANLTNNGSVQISHSTTFNKTSGAYKNSGQFTIDASKTLTLSSTPTFEQAGGTLDVLGSFKQTGGTFKYSGGTINGVPELSGSTFNLASGNTNPFSVLMGGGTLSLADAVLSPGQVITMSSTVTSANGFLNNGSLYAAAGMTITNGTLINGTNGLMQLAGTFTGNLTNNGSVQVNAATTLTKSGGGGLFTNNGQFSIASGQTLTVSGTQTFDQAAGTLDILGTWSQSTGTFKYTGGAIHGIVGLFGGTLNIGPGGTGAASFLLESSNTLSIGPNVVSAGQVITVRGGTSPASATSAGGFTNYGSILLTGTSSQSTTLTLTGGTLTNGAIGLLHFQTGGSGSRTFNGNLTNNGTVLVDRTTTFNKSGGTYLNNGQFTIAASQVLTLSSGSYLQTGGTTTVNGALSSLSTVTFSGGQLNGTGTISAPVDIVGATVEPGHSAGKLSISGTYKQQSGGMLVIELGGTADGKWDVLATSGKATLGGTLDVRLIDSGSGMFMPAAGQSFTFLTSGSGVVNQFEHYVLPPLSSNLSWNVRYSAFSVALAVEAVPEPATLLLWLMAIVATCSHYRSRPRYRVLLDPVF
jgi:fibronectin-binding autotransporter adhesin